MPRTARITMENTCYHVITRGNQKQTVFLANEDYQRYLNMLNKYKKKYQFKLYCFCLMPNHVHLVIEVGPIDKLKKIMHGLNLSYTIFFNFKYKKVGHLWQDRYKSKIISQDAYLLECISYIENNPIRAALVDKITDYPWNSYVFRTKNSRLLDKIFSI